MTLPAPDSRTLLRPRENLANSRDWLPQRSLVSITLPGMSLANGEGKISTRAMLRIQRYSNGGVVFSLSGRIEVDDVVELQRLLSLEAAGRDIAFDLQDITLVDRDALKYLARCETESVRLENCPAYIRNWIAMERGPSSQQDR